MVIPNKLEGKVVKATTEVDIEEELAAETKPLGIAPNLRPPCSKRMAEH